MERFLRVEPRIIAHDLHPQYVSSVYARQSRAGRKIAVQHHHAHIASAMAEHGLAGPVLGVAFDGTGYGTDGTAWGGELFVCRIEDYERLATFRPIALAGGETAIREPWRIALALLEDSFPEGPPLDRLPLFAGVEEQALHVARQMLRSRFQVSLARGVGRYFDGFGALFLSRPFSRHEGQVAFAWNVASDEAETARIPSGGSRALNAGAGPAAGGAGSRGGLSLGSLRGSDLRALPQHGGEGDRRARPARRREMRPPAGRAHGRLFQNALLTERVLGELQDFRVFLHRRVPPGDGGLALGQAAVAGALAGSGGL